MDNNPFVIDADDLNWLFDGQALVVSKFERQSSPQALTQSIGQPEAQVEPVKGKIEASAPKPTSAQVTEETLPTLAALKGLKPTPKSAAAPSQVGVKEEGNPAAQVLVLMSQVPGLQLLPSQKAMLEKLLMAINLNKATTHTLIAETLTEAVVAEKLASKQYSRVIAFGLKIQPNDALFTPLLHQGITYVISTPISELETQVDQKKQLWSALQQVFVN